MRVVFFSDTHLGLDMPARPRVERRRRGEDFFDNVNRVLAYARAERADLVLHGGDLFFRSRVPPFIVDRVYQLLVDFVSSTGIPLGVIAGNHERSALPRSLLLSHPLIHVFHEPSTHRFGEITVTGLPFMGDGARFVDNAKSGGNILLAHEAFESAQCGPNDFTFRAGRDDVVPLAGVSETFDVVLSGHIHRRQVLRRSRSDGTNLPIVYAGSVERTSFAEKNETKSFAVIDLFGEQRGRIRFVPLPARPMIELDANEHSRDELLTLLSQVPKDAIVRVFGAHDLHGEILRTLPSSATFSYGGGRPPPCGGGQARRGTSPAGDMPGGGQAPALPSQRDGAEGWEGELD